MAPYRSSDQLSAIPTGQPL